LTAPNRGAPRERVCRNGREGKLTTRSEACIGVDSASARLERARRRRQRRCLGRIARCALRPLARAAKAALVRRRKGPYRRKALRIAASLASSRGPGGSDLGPAPLDPAERGQGVALGDRGARGTVARRTTSRQRSRHSRCDPPKRQSGWREPPLSPEQATRGPKRAPPAAAKAAVTGREPARCGSSQT
jgi:hypothetical protein